MTDGFVPVSQHSPLNTEIVVSVAGQQADLVLPWDIGAISFVPHGHISVTSSEEADKPTHYLSLMKSYHKGLKVFGLTIGLLVVLFH